MPSIKGDWIHIPVKGEEGKHKNHEIRTIKISEKKGIRALYCLDCKKIITWLFHKDKWTMEKAKKWLDEHNIPYEEMFEGGFVRCPNCSSYVDSNEFLKKGCLHCGFLSVKYISLSQKFCCECINCGFKMETDKHCIDLRCLRCGGEMRRCERPGSGRSENDL